MEITTKPVSPDEIHQFSRILLHAYPGLFTPASLETIQQRSAAQREYTDCSLIGAYRDGALVGGVLLHDFRMNFRGRMIDAGGLGSLAVDQLHRKEHIAKQLILSSFALLRQKRHSLMLLYPFNVKFYRNFGFGLGQKINHYTIKPSLLPFTTKQNIVVLGPERKGELLDCYERYVQSHPGMISKTCSEQRKILASEDMRCVAVEGEGGVRAYALFQYKTVPESGFLTNDISVRELICLDMESRLQMLSFFNSLQDQFRYILIDTQDHIDHILEDIYYHDGALIPHVYHQSNIQGAGLMYKILDIERLFDLGGFHGKLDFGCEFHVTDPVDWKESQTFLPGKRNEYVVHVYLAVGELSSLIMGTVSFASLMKYGMVQCSDPAVVGDIQDLFRIDPPECTTCF